MSGSDRQREKAVAAYRDLVLERGYQPTGPEIAARSGVPFRTLYRLFPGLEGLREPTVPKRPYRARAVEELKVPKAPKVLTVSAAADIYRLGRYHRQEITWRTAQSFRETLRLFAYHVGRQRPLATITRADIEDYWGTMRRLAPATVRLRLGTLRNFFQWAVIEGYVKVDPTLGIKLPKLPRFLPRGLSRDQLDALLAAVADDRERLIVLLMAGEGLRAIEVARLQVGDIDFERQTMRVLGKGNFERVLPITQEVWGAIDGYLEVRGRHAGHLLQSYQQSYANPSDGLTPTYVSTLMGNAFRRAEVRGSGHFLRHTFATAMLENGANVRDVQTALGHLSLNNTARYLGITAASDLRPLMERHTVRRPLRPENMEDDS